MPHDRPWTRIADHLRAEISQGTIPPGARLPPGRELMARYGVARQTLQNAMEQLISEGLVSSSPGIGWFAADRQPIVRLSRHRLSRTERNEGRGAFLTDAQPGGWEPRVEVTVRQEPSPAGVAAALGLPPGTSVVTRDRVMSDGGQPIQLAISYLPAQIAAGTALADINTGPGGLYARLEELGHQLSHYTETVTAQVPTPEQSRILGLAPRVPVLHIQRITYTTSNQPIEVNHITLNSQRFELQYRIDQEP